MSGVDMDSIAHELLAAYRTGKTLPPLTSTYTGLTVDDAYAIQQRQTDTRTNAGAGIVGFKIGRTSAAMQQQLGVDQPDYGHLFTDMLRRRHADPDQRVPAAAGRARDRARPRSHAPWSGTQRHRRPQRDRLRPARHRDHRQPHHRLADRPGRHHRRQRLQRRTRPRQHPHRDRRPRPLAARLRPAAQRPHPAHGRGCRGDGLALQAATWLANTLTARGVELAAGHVILTGSLTVAVAVQAGDTILSTLDHLGAVTAVFD